MVTQALIGTDSSSQCQSIQCVWFNINHLC